MTGGGWGRETGPVGWKWGDLWGHSSHQITPTHLPAHASGWLPTGGHSFPHFSFHLWLLLQLPGQVNPDHLLHTPPLGGVLFSTPISKFHLAPAQVSRGTGACILALCRLPLPVWPPIVPRCGFCMGSAIQVGFLGGGQSATSGPLPPRQDGSRSWGETYFFTVQKRRWGRSTH